MPSPDSGAGRPLFDPNARPLLGRVAWVTGASRGIGRAIAFGLARAGATVALGARSLEQTQQAAQALTDQGFSAVALPLDVSNWASCQEFARAARDAQGPVSILVNNAGMGMARPLNNFNEGDFERVYAVNVFGPYYMSKLAVPMMKEEGSGDIVNIGSLAGDSSSPSGGAYFSSKAALHSFSRCLFDEVRSWGIRVTLVKPGSVDTRFHNDAHGGSHQVDGDWMAQPEQVANAVVLAVTMPSPSIVGEISVRPLKRSK